MNPLILAVSPLVRMFVSSLAASLAVAVVFSFAVLGLVRAGDMRRAAREGAATAYVALAVISLVITAAIVVVGLYLVAHKS